MTRKAITVASALLATFIVTSSSAFAAKRGIELPLKFSVSETNVFNLATFSNHYSGTEIASHAGEGTVEGDGESQLSGFNTLEYQDKWVFTAPSGDKVFGTSAGTITGGPEGLLNSSESVVTQTITGGTGRFQNATGTVTGRYHLAFISFNEEGEVVSSLQGGGTGTASY